MTRLCYINLLILIVSIEGSLLPRVVTTPIILMMAMILMMIIVNIIITIGNDTDIDIIDIDVIVTICHYILYRSLPFIT